MSRINIDQKKTLTLPDILAKKGKTGQKLVVITCYDSAFADLIERTSVDIVLVGDSPGNVVLGFDNTIPVTMDHMVHHTAAVARRLHRPFLVADMPFLSYALSVEQALANAGRLVQQGGAKAVKLEGGRAICDKVRALVDAGIPVMGHLGLTPQSVHAKGGYKVQGRGADARQRLIDDAGLLVDAGIFSLVLELIPAPLAAEVTRQIAVPTIGIGAGSQTDGQVLVLHDMLGMNLDFSPKFVKKYATMGDGVIKALESYADDVREGQFPADEHSYLT